MAELARRLGIARKEYVSLEKKAGCYAFERYLTRELMKRSRTDRERDDWELEEAALECIAAAEQQEMQVLQAEMGRCESLLEAAKRHANS